MDISTFFLLNSTFSQTPVCLDNAEVTWDISIELIKGNYSSIQIPLIVQQKSGTKWTDFLNPSGQLKIVSNKFIELLESNKITGWSKFKLKIFDKNGTEAFGYSGFSVIGRCGKIDYSKSFVYENQLVPNGSICKVYKGLYFGYEQWDGSDIFMPEDSLHIIISKKVQDLIKKNKITNIKMQNLADYEVDEYSLPKSFLNSLKFSQN